MGIVPLLNCRKLIFAIRHIFNSFEILKFKGTMHIINTAFYHEENDNMLQKKKQL